MNLSTAASIGMGFLKRQDALTEALGGAGGNLPMLSKLAGAGFAKIAQRFNLPEKLSGQIQDNLQALADPNGVNTLQAIHQLRFFDTDNNQQVTREELSAGLQRLEAAGLNQHAAFGKLHGMGEMLLKNYDKAAGLDGNAGSLSYRDMGKLAGLDQKYTTIADADWQKLNA